MDPLAHGLIIREVPVQRARPTVLPVLLAAGCTVCGAPRGEQQRVPFGVNPGWTNPCGHQDSAATAVHESISLISHLVGPQVDNVFVRTFAQCYLDVAAEAFVPNPVPCGRTTPPEGAR